jgi:low-affinity ferrous iron transport protein
MLRQIASTGEQKTVRLHNVEEQELPGFALELPSENWLGRVSTHASNIIGHIVTVGLFWVCIFIWIGFGHYCGWSNQWQLYINSATSALMVFIFAFLANIRERHNRYAERCLDIIFKADASLERNLRLKTNDTVPNPPVVVPAPKVTRIQRAIDYYADVVGTLVGIVLLLLVIIAWVAIGPVLSWSSNWWLFIGTYAGLVGTNDGFVLRNVDFQLRKYEDEQLELIRLDDIELFQALDVPQPPDDQADDTSLSSRISIQMGKVCSHEVTVVLGAASVIGLIIGSSAMHWSLTGQLLSNIPPSIIESFFMMILVTSHNIADSRRRLILHGIYERRLKLHSYVGLVSKQV